MINNEIRVKKYKGLCFWCDEKFNLRHHCKRRELNIIVVQEEEDFNNEVEVKAKESEGTTIEEVAMKIANLSLNSLVGLSSPRRYM